MLRVLDHIDAPRRCLRQRLELVVVAAWLSAACGAETSGPPSTEPSVGSAEPAESAQSDVTTEIDAGVSSEEACKPASGTTGSPQTVLEVIELINGLPMPVTLPCFLRSLDRPLQLVATSSVVSAQPAQGVANPRLFIVSDALSLSVVPRGPGRNLLEIGEITAPNRSIKGELEFPVEAPLALDAAFTHIAESSERTHCHGCHFPETPATDYPVAGAFESIAYRSIPRYEVNFDYVAYQFTTCDYSVDLDRCSMLAALFDQGQVFPGAFPAEMPTFE